MLSTAAVAAFWRTACTHDVDTNVHVPMPPMASESKFAFFFVTLKCVGYEAFSHCIS